MPGTYRDMTTWFSEHIVNSGRLALFCFFAAMIVGFALTRLSVRMIRAGVRWWPGNIETDGGMHIHHVVFGVVLMVGGGLAGLVLDSEQRGWTAVAAAVFGVGTALVLDEFALILHLRDVYWSTAGRSSVDAVFVAVAVTGLLLLGWHPSVLDDVETLRESGGVGWALAIGWTILAINLCTVALSLLKGKVWVGLFGLFVPLLAIVGAIRLGRPGSPWARWRYREESKQLARARWRERRLREPLIRAKIRVQELIAGRFDSHPGG